MNNTLISILTSNTRFINKVKAIGLPITSNGIFMYTIVVPVCSEIRACNVLCKFAEETKATVSMYIFYQDPGTGESSDALMVFVKGESLPTVFPHMNIFSFVGPTPPCYISSSNI